MGRRATERRPHTRTHAGGRAGGRPRGSPHRVPLFGSHLVPVARPSSAAALVRFQLPGSAGR